MRFFDNDRWVGRFALERNARYEFTIEAWRDTFSSWLDEVRKKQTAGVNVRLETIEGVHIAEEAASRATGAEGQGLTELLRRPKRSEERRGGKERRSRW